MVCTLLLRGPLALSGPSRPTQAVYKAFYGVTKGGGQYGFTEALNWEVIKKLPYKFSDLGVSAEIKAFSIHLLQGPLGRIQKQRSVGRLYQDYLQGESVLDLGCDVRGLEEFVGPTTRYTGVDMHGKPDVLVNLDNDSFPFSERSFDTIVCVETLEHLQRMHSVFDKILSASRNNVICSLPNEFSHAKNRFMDSLGIPSSSVFTPVAPVFDRHEWLGGVSDGLDFLYYRAALSGFKIKRVDLFYFPRSFGAGQEVAIVKSFMLGDIHHLNNRVGMIIVVLERINLESEAP